MTYLEGVVSKLRLSPGKTTAVRNLILKLIPATAGNEI